MPDRTLFAEYLEQLNIPVPQPLDEYVEEDGSIVLTIRDNAIRVRYSEAVNGFLFTAVVLEAYGIAIEDLVCEILALNGNLEDTAGLVFGMSDSSTIVATFCVPAAIADAELLAETTLAVVDSCEQWRAVFESELRRLIACGGQRSDSESPLQGATPV